MSEAALTRLRPLGRFLRRDAEAILAEALGWHYSRSKLTKEANRWLTARCADGAILCVGTLAVRGGLQARVYFVPDRRIEPDPRFRYLSPLLAHEGS